MMRGRQLIGVGPLHVIDHVAAVLAAMQIDRDEAGLRCHETGALLHQGQHLVLIVGRELDRRNLGADAVSFADFGHDRLLVAGDAG
jgi:hypothetical protein